MLHVDALVEIYMNRVLWQYIRNRNVDFFLRYVGRVSYRKWELNCIAKEKFGKTGRGRSCRWRENVYKVTWVWKVLEVWWTEWWSLRLNGGSGDGYPRLWSNVLSGYKSDVTRSPGYYANVLRDGNSVIIRWKVGEGEESRLILRYELEDQVGDDPRGHHAYGKGEVWVKRGFDEFTF